MAGKDFCFSPPPPLDTPFVHTIMVSFRRQPTKAAIIGVSFFTIYTLHRCYDQKLSAPTSILLLALSALISAFFLFVEPINQPQSYHNFADKRLFLCSCHDAATEGFFLPPGTQQRRRGGFIIPNFGDVVSNIVILAGGVFGLVLQLNSAEFISEPSRKWQLQVCLPIFFYSTVAIAAGSTYYHWSPSDSSLVWDRLPMTLAFVSIFGYILEDYMPTTGVGQALMSPLLVIGIFSVLYWKWTDDLRLYVLVQFLPLLLITALLVCCNSKHGGAFQQALGLGCYALAKICEERDYEIYSATGKRISGHSLKHVLAGLASVSIATMLM